MTKKILRTASFGICSAWYYGGTCSVSISTLLLANCSAYTMKPRKQCVIFLGNYDQRQRYMFRDVVSGCKPYLWSPILQTRPTVWLHSCVTLALRQCKQRRARRTRDV